MTARVNRQRPTPELDQATLDYYEPMILKLMVSIVLYRMELEDEAAAQAAAAPAPATESGAGCEPAPREGACVSSGEEAFAKQAYEVRPALSSSEPSGHPYTVGRIEYASKS